ncbi:MAG: HNH endonuclease signature motif containing protein [Candidatus Competibacter denitrificans]
MAKINRNSVFDAEKCISCLLDSHASNRKNIVLFLSEQIKFANKIDPINWNLNLALDGSFLRFNVGQEYCIELYEHQVLVLCLKQKLPIEIQQGHNDFFFRGYKQGLGEINNESFNKTPQILAKVPNSIGIVFKRNIEKWIPYISNSNSCFIEYAVSKTKILPQMINAHSVGAIEFLSRVIGEKTPNPIFAYNSVIENEKIMQGKLKHISNKKLSELAQSYDPIPLKIETRTSMFLRNPYVAEQAKRLAEGRCQDCGNPAPFVNKSTNELFLEVHHIIPLSQGGKDILKNVVALCPNCHRKRHYG